MAVQMNYIGFDQSVTFSPVGVNGLVKEVLFGDVRAREDGLVEFTMGRTSVAGVILERRKPEDEEVVSFEGDIGVQLPILLGTS